MAVGALKSLFTDLSSSTFLSGVTVLFGEEMIADEQITPPKIVLVPLGGPYLDGPGYIANLDPNVEYIATARESIDIYCIGFSTATNAQPIDHADECENIRQKVISAFQDQRNQQNTDGSSAPGLWWKPVNTRWMMDQNTVNRFGRARVETFVIDISIPMAAPTEATITGITETFSVTNGQHV